MPQRFAYILTWSVFLSIAVGACSSAESTRAESGRSPSSVASDSTAVRADPVRRRGGGGPSSDVISTLIQEALQSDGSVSYRTLIRQLGRPQRVRTETVPNRYVRDQVDTLRTLVYGGVEALIYDVANESKTFLVRFSLSTARYTTPEGLRVGLTKQRVIDILGPPTRRNSSKDELIYRETTPKSTSMSVQLRNGRVVQIDWEFPFA